VQHRLFVTLALGGVSAIGLGGLACIKPLAYSALTLKLWCIVKREFNQLWKEVSRHGFRDDIYLVAAPCLFGGILRLHFIDRPIHFDEAYTFIRLAERPWYIAISNYAYPNNHILHTILVKTTTSFLGDAEWSIRFPAFSAGVLLIAATFLLARVAAGRSAAIVAAWLVAVSPRAVDLSVNGRGYTLQALLVTVGAAVLLSALSDGGIRKFAIFALCCWLAFWTLPTTMFFFVGISIWFVMEVAVKRRFARKTMLSRYLCSAAVVSIATSMSYLPAIIYSGWESLAQNKYVSGRSLTAFLEGNQAELYLALMEWRRLWFPGAQWLFLLLVLVYLVAFWRRSANARLLAWLIFATALLILLRRMVPFARVYFFLLPFLLCAVAIVLTQAWSFWEARQQRAVDLRICSWTACVLGILLGVKVWNSSYIAESLETGALLSAKAIARDLGMTRVSGRCVGGTIVPTLTVNYYMRRHGGAGAEKVGGCEGSEFYVIVHDAVGETEEMVLEHLGLTRRRWTVWRKYPDATVLRCERN
jgi:hypothetical protein